MIDDDLEPPPDFSPHVMPDPVEMEVHIKAEGMRLDHYIQMNSQETSRGVIQDAIKIGNVTVNGKPSKSSHKVRNGDKLWIQFPMITHAIPIPEDIPLDIIYEDEFLAIINKPFDMVVHPAKGNWSGTLVNALQFHFAKLSSAQGEHRTGIVHRLDKDTSGAILIAKEEFTHREMSMAFEKRQVFKEYAALTGGVLDRDSDYIELRIKHHPSDRIKMFTTSDKNDLDAKDAMTFYEVVERFRGHTFVRCQPKTGRTHQIRIHLASAGCPVLADKTYGGRDHLNLSDLVENLPESQEERLLSRQALHAFRLRFKHPRLLKWMEFEAPLPADFQRTLAALRQFRKWK